MAVQTKRVIIPEDMGSTVEFGGKETDKWNVNHDDTLTVKNGKLSVVPQQSGGLDCAAVGNLPKKPWAKGTTILARGADGACHQLTALDSIFQEVGVGIAANKLSGLTGEKYHVVVTVSNTGEGTNERTDLVIVRPQLGNYTANNFTKTASTGATIERTDDWNYVIKNLRKGGTARVEFDVTPNSAGTFQFNANVNPNSALDQQSNNNRATITLSASTPVLVDSDTSAECPYVDVTDIGLNKPLITGLSNVNVYTKRTSLNGLKLRIGEAKVVAVAVDATSGGNGKDDVGFMVDNVLKGVSLNTSFPTRYLPQKANSEPFSNQTVRNEYITFADGVLTIVKHCKNMLVAMRKSRECVWQYVLLSAMVDLPSMPTAKVSGVPASLYTLETNTYTFANPTSPYFPNSNQYNDLGYKLSYFAADDTTKPVSTRRPSFRVNFRLPKGKVYTPTVTTTNMQIYPIQTVGAITVPDSVVSADNGQSLTFTVASTATPVDSKRVANPYSGAEITISVEIV